MYQKLQKKEWSALPRPRELSDDAKTPECMLENMPGTYGRCQKRCWNRCPVYAWSARIGAYAACELGALLGAINHVSMPSGYNTGYKGYMHLEFDWFKKHGAPGRGVADRRSPEGSTHISATGFDHEHASILKAGKEPTDVDWQNVEIDYEALGSLSLGLRALNLTSLGLPFEGPNGLQEWKLQSPGAHLNFRGSHSVCVPRDNSRPY
jgi:hypothetical protein